MNTRNIETLSSSGGSFISSSDATALHTSSCVTSSSSCDRYLTTPRGCISKPIRRRSRASKRTPTTLLNADAKDFRSLVQQFTGCRHRSTCISFGKPRGDSSVNINFALGKEQGYDMINATNNTHASISQPLIEDDYSPQPQLMQQQQQQQQQKQEVHQPQYYQGQVWNEDEQQDQWELSFEGMIAADYLPTSISPTCFPQPQGGIFMDDLFFLA